MNVLDSERERERERERREREIWCDWEGRHRTNERAREKHLLADITDSDIVGGQ